MTSLLYDFTIVSRSGNSDQSNSSNLTFKNFPGGACPWTPLGGCASDTQVRLRRTFWNSLDKGPMLHCDPGPTNSLRGPVHTKCFQLENVEFLVHFAPRIRRFKTNESSEYLLRTVCGPSKSK